MNKLKYLLLFLIITHCWIMYNKYYNSPIDGDLARICTPSKDYKKVLENPFGTPVLRGENYAATNRFTAHFLMKIYFENVPRIIKLESVEGILHSQAILKLFTHLFLIFLMIYFLNIFIKLNFCQLIFTYLILIPFFLYGQNYFYPITEYFCQIDVGITYAFFYATFLSFSVLFLIPFFKDFHFKNKYLKVLWYIGVPFLAFGGPLNSPFLIISSMLIFLNYFKENKIKNFSKFIPYIWINLWSFYSLYIGSFNTENFAKSISISERYSLLFKGFVQLFNPSYGAWIWLLVSITIFLIYIYKRNENNDKKFIKIALILIGFCILWFLLLPFGGYRVYRPLIVRRDSILPINLVLIFLFVSSLILILKNVSKKNIIMSIISIPVLAFYSYHFIVTPAPKSNDVEQFNHLKSSSVNCVELPQKGTLLDWGYYQNCQQSEWNIKFLHRINLIDSSVRYQYKMD